MDINENIGVAFQIRFETFRFQNPSFSRTQDSPFIYQFSGGCLGFSRTFVGSNFHLGFTSRIAVNLNHFVYSDLIEDWETVSSGKSYNLSLYKYLWIGTYESLTVTEN